MEDSNIEARTRNHLQHPTGTVTVTGITQFTGISRIHWTAVAFSQEGSDFIQHTIMPDRLLDEQQHLLGISHLEEMIGMTLDLITGRDGWDRFDKPKNITPCQPH